MRRRGFTLIEILVALAIVFMLCALVFAALGPVRERARQRACASNMHQWGLALSMYMQDNDGIEPQIGQPLSYSQMGLPPVSYEFQFAKDYKLSAYELRWCPSSHLSSHNPFISPGTLTSYWLTAFWGSEYPELYPRLASKYGPNLPLSVCDMHNADTDFEDQPTWAEKWVQTLRIDQHIDFRQYKVTIDPMNE